MWALEKHVDSEKSFSPASSCFEHELDRGLVCIEHLVPTSLTMPHHIPLSPPTQRMSTLGIVCWCVCPLPVLLVRSQMLNAWCAPATADPTYGVLHELPHNHTTSPDITRETVVCFVDDFWCTIAECRGVLPQRCGHRPGKVILVGLHALQQKECTLAKVAQF